MIMKPEKQSIVISAVNVTDGGPLTILQECLRSLSESPIAQKYKIIALVHSKNKCYYNHIEYIEIPRSKKQWIFRIYYEYIYFKKLSKKIKPYLWLSLHDTTPNVTARKRAVYMHNASPFHAWKWRDIYFNYKYVCFALFYKYLYKINIKKNDFLIVQQDWLRKEFSQMFNFPKEQIIVNRPHNTTAKHSVPILKHNEAEPNLFRFIFISLVRPFKNFEVICEAVRILNKKHPDGFEVVLTLNGTENRYAKWLYNKYIDTKNIRFTGLIPHEKIDEYYQISDCMIFPSKLETWGLPISEYATYNRPIIAADLPYAYETAAGHDLTAFFNPDNPEELAELMLNAMNAHFERFGSIPQITNTPLLINGFPKLLEVLLQD